MADKRSGSIDRKHDNFLIGICVALSIVYSHGEETLAEEIVGACGTRELLDVAVRNQEPCIHDLRKTVRRLRANERWRKRMEKAA